jgi:DNA-binding GntR family transcriptional regulator
MSRAIAPTSGLSRLSLPADRPAHLLREVVYDTLKQAIVDGTLPPDERLRDGDIAEALDVSRMPVREALRRLADEGLVIAEASRWTKVAPIDFGAAERIYPLIWTLEGLALEVAPEWTADRLARMTSANDALRQALELGDPVAASLADDLFHDVLLEAARNPELVTIVRDLKVRVRRIEIGFFGGTGTATQSCREHASIVDAVASGDLAMAKRSLEQNWRGSLDRGLQRYRTEREEHANG